jgi:hypothetical protein
VTDASRSLTQARYANVPARTLQSGDRTPEGLVVLRTSPIDKALAIRFEGDDTIWRVHPDSLVQIEVRP